MIRRGACTGTVLREGAASCLVLLWPNPTCDSPIDQIGRIHLQGYKVAYP